MSMLLRTTAFAAAMAVPQMASACAQLSENIWMCARGNAWETATWDQFGDGSAMLLRDLVFNFNEDFPGQELTDESTTLEEQYVFLAAWQQDIYDDDFPAPQVLRTDLVEKEHVIAHRVLQRGSWEGQPYLETLMIAQVGRHRILLQLEGPGDMPISQMDAEANNILSYLRNTCADPVSCAEDYEWPPAAPVKEQ